MSYSIYTDGSCKANGKNNAIGGWAFAIYGTDDDLISYASGSEVDTTNNRMELTAMIEGIKCINAFAKELDNITIITDSKYIYNCYSQKWYHSWITNNWKKSDKKKVLNRDLWENLIPFFEDSRFNFKWVKGHDINEKNNYVDELCQCAAELRKSKERKND